ncbi:hypothetical protein AB0I28_37955 [Phytomonospora sp. NPDC050363]|uniref:hypothetical protein n=1 Tax=Phytomonospora sp. NPDC050363 TaxID=3155642 RepID=UPI003407E8F3
MKSAGDHHLFADAEAPAAVARLRGVDPPPPALLLPDLGAAVGPVGFTGAEQVRVTAVDAPVSTVHSALRRSIAPGVGEVGTQLPHTPYCTC